MVVAFTAANAAVWSAVGLLPPERTLRTWERLLLDAEGLLPEVGPAVVLAAAALENLIAYILGILARPAVTPAGLWDWTTQREDTFARPSVEEQFDSLLKVFTGKSLKTDAALLWVSFKHLKTARNKFVHQGVALIGKTEVTPETAATLVDGARKVVDWVEQLLPTELRRAAPIAMTFEFTKALGVTIVSPDV